MGRMGTIKLLQASANRSKVTETYSLMNLNTKYLQ